MHPTTHEQSTYNQKANEIRIINNESAFAEKMQEEFNTRKAKAIEQYFKKRKLNQFSLKKLKIKPLKITSEKIAFMEVGQAFHSLDRPPHIKPESKEYKNGERISDKVGAVPAKTLIDWVQSSIV